MDILWLHIKYRVISFHIPFDGGDHRGTYLFQLLTHHQDSLCETGAEADIVVSMTGPSPIPGIGGTGGSCSSDQRLSSEIRREIPQRKPAINKTVMEMGMVYY